MNCMDCGAGNSDEAVFCQRCGKQLEPTRFGIPTSLTPPNASASSHGNLSYESKEYASAEPSYPPPPPITHYGSNPYEQPPLRSHTNMRYLIVIAVLVLMLITSGGLVGILIEKGNTQGTASNPTSTVVTSTPIPASPQPGTLLYQANWSNGLNGWIGSPDWKSEGGMLVSDGTYQGTHGSQESPTIEPPYQVNETPDYAVEVRIQQQLGGPGCFDAVNIRGSAASDGIQGYRLAIGCYGGATIYAAHGSSLTQIAHEDFDPGNTWHIYRLEAKGTTISAFIDGIQVFGVSDATYLSGGIIGIKSQGTQINVSSFKVIVV